MSERMNPRRVFDRFALPGLRGFADELPDPPDNPDFELFSERKQSELDDKFQRGIALSQRNRHLANAARIRARKLRQARANAPRHARYAPKLSDVLLAAGKRLDTGRTPC